MSDADSKVTDSLNKLAEERIRLQVNLDDLDSKFKADEASLKTTYKENSAGLAEAIREVDSQIWQLINDNRSSLIKAPKKSFVILSGVFKFTRSNPKVDVVNEAGVMAVARRLGVVKLVAKPPTHRWSFSKTMFNEWIKRNEALLPKFGGAVAVTEESETLGLQPNATYVVGHDKERISPKSITIKKNEASSPD